MIKVGIVGSTGYTGAELVRILLGHPEAEIGALCSETHSGRPFWEVYPALSGMLGEVCVPYETSRIARDCDVVFTALPHKKAMEYIPQILRGDCLVIDLSADFRLKDPVTYERWYGARHTASELLERAVYGLPELHRREIREAGLIANPGCYPTGAILAAAPLLREGLIHADTIVINSASGVTGAGRSLTIGSLFCEVNEGMRPYGVGRHRHTPEMEQEMGIILGEEVRVTFVPHLAPMSRGILTTLCCRAKDGVSDAMIRNAYESFYGGEPFVRVLPEGVFPNVRDVRGSNYCDIGLVLEQRTRRVVVMSAIDNLVKGASGQAVQNMNIAMGIEETAGLMGAPLFL